MGPQYQVNAVQTVIGDILNVNKERLAPAFWADWQAGKIKVLPKTKILRLRITPGSNAKVELIDDETKIIPNVSDFGGKNFPVNTNLIVGSMGVGYGTDGATGKEAILAYKQVAPASVRNATFAVSQNGAVIAAYPLSDLMNENVVRSIEPNSGKIALPLAFLLTSVEDFDFELRYPKGAGPVLSPAGIKEYLEFRFFGYETARAK